MSFDNYNKGNIKSNDSVNTRGLQFKNSKGFESSTLVMQYWDDKLNITLHPQLANPSEKQVYDYEKKIMCTLRQEKAQALLKGCELIIDKAIEEGKEQSVALRLSGVNMIVISTVLKEDSLYVVATVCRDINPETRKPSQRYSYTFIKEDELVKGYNPKSGEFEEVQELQSEYELFKEGLKAYIETRTQGQCHSDRYNDKFYRNKMYENVGAIAGKMGVANSGHHTGSYNSSSAFANVNDDEGSGYQPTTSLNDLADIF